MKQIDTCTLKHIIYINNTCRYSWERKDITIVIELYMSKRNWKNILFILSFCERSEPNFLGKNWLLYLLICCIHSNFQFKIHRTRNQGLQIEISRKVPSIQGLFKDKFIFKDFSRKAQNSRTFQGLWEPCKAFEENYNSTNVV